jgi:hypothetical protein
VVYLSGVLPDNTPTYALTKSLYVVLAITPLAAAALMAQGLQSDIRRIAFVGGIVASVMITISPSFGAELKLWGAMSEESPAMAQRLLDLSVRGATATHVVCQPSPYLDPVDNYLCNRWTESLSRVQQSGGFRADVLNEGGAAPIAWAKAQSKGLLRDAVVGNASEVMFGACVPPGMSAAPPEAVGKTLDVQTHPVAAAARPLGVGSIDSVQECSRTVVIWGWAPFTNDRESLDVYADKAVSIRSVSRFDRPDVVQVTGDSTLVAPGFVIVLDGERLSMADICLVSRGASLPGSSSDVCPVSAPARASGR